MPGLILFIISALISFSASASVVIMGTRVIYPEQKKSINVQLHNGENSPSLVQPCTDPQVSLIFLCTGYPVTVIIQVIVNKRGRYTRLPLCR